MGDSWCRDGPLQISTLELPGSKATGSKSCPRTNRWSVGTVDRRRSLVTKPPHFGNPSDHFGDLTTGSRRLKSKTPDVAPVKEKDRGAVFV